MSNETQASEPAFPVQDASTWQAHGMTLRDYFAAKAMHAMLSAYPCQALHRDEGGIQADFDMLAGDAFDMADALLAARQEQPK